MQFQRRLFVTVLCALLAMAPGVSAAWSQEVRQTIQIAAPGPEGGPLQMLQPGRQAKTGTGQLRGRVVANDTGAAVRRAQVRISGSDIGAKTALTDAQGRYEFRDLPAGRFNLSASKSGFVTMQFGQRRPFEPGRPIELVEAQVMEKADMALPRGSVVSGRVVDEFGEAVAEAEVVAMRMQFQNGKRKLTPAPGRNATTNDLGQFRLYGLPPGEYYVSATLRNMTMMFDMLGAGAGGPTGSNQNTGYAATYYPGTASPADAQRVTLGVGQELPSVDIQLQPVRLAKITGVAVGSDGKPMASSMVMLMPANRDALQFMPGGTSRTNKDGQFTLSGVTPGEYSLQVQSMGAMFQAAGNAMAFAFSTSSDGPAPAAAAPQEREFAVASVNVAGEDITGLVVVGTRGAKASGKITFAGGVAPEGVSTIRLMAGSTEADGMGTGMAGFGGSTVKDDGAFTMDGLAGGRMFRVISGPKGWILKRVTVNGEDVTDKGIEFKPGEDVSDITIELTNKTTSLAGNVNDDRGQPLKDYTVVVFAEDQAKWALPANRWISSARPDQDGRFKVNNLPAGAYNAVAVEYVAQGEWNDPDWLARAAKNATRFTLDEGETKTIDLKRSGS